MIDSDMSHVSVVMSTHFSVCQPLLRVHQLHSTPSQNMGNFNRLERSANANRHCLSCGLKACLVQDF